MGDRIAELAQGDYYVAPPERPGRGWERGGFPPELAEVDAAVRRLLDDLGTARFERSYYYCYARHLWKLRNTKTGGALAVEAECSMVWYVCHGLSRSVMEAIRDRVFRIPEPSLP